MLIGIVLWSNEGIELHNDIKTIENLVNLIKGTLGLICNLIIFFFINVKKRKETLL